jgi:hypothetical protein
MRLPPEASGESSWTFWRDYCFAPSAGAIAAKLIEATLDARGVRFNRDVGSYRLPRLDRERAGDVGSYGRKRVLEAPIPVTPHWWHDAAAVDLTSLVSWARTTSGTDVTFFVPPILARMRVALGSDGERFFEAVARAVGPGLVDLAAVDSLDAGSDFYDVKHFTPEGGARVAQLLLAAAAKRVPETQVAAGNEP